MVQQVKDEQGQIHEFPNDATPEEMNAAISGSVAKPSLKNSIINSMKSYISSPGTPTGINIATGLMSLAGKSPIQKELMKNVPQALTQTQPGISEKLEQGFGETLPLTLATSGVSLPGRISAMTGYGAALSPEDRIKGAETGFLTAIAGEAIPGTLKGIGEIAEKLRPIKYVQNKISELQNTYSNSVKEQKESYGKVMDALGQNKLTDTPEDYLGFDKKNMSLLAQKKYDVFIKNKDLQSLHDLQSQLFKDSATPNRFKASTETEGINIRDKATIERENIVNKIKDYLSQHPEYQSLYKSASDITRDIIKPFESTKAMRDMIKGKVNQMMPNKFASTLNTALNKEGIEFIKDHPMRQALSEINEKLQPGDLFKSIVPKARTWLSPNFVKIAQNPKTIEFLRTANLGYHPLKHSLLGFTQGLLGLTQEP